MAATDQAWPGALVVVACALTTRLHAAWPFETVAVLFFTATIPLLGHAAGDPLRVALHAIHILAAGAWLGSLAMAGCWFAFPTPTRTPVYASYGGQRVRSQILRRFSPVALTSAAVASVAGIVAAYLYLGAFSNLWTTPYGRMLVVKVALVGSIAACGYSNWQRLRKSHPHKLTDETLIVLEVLLSIAVVLVTALLTETGHPG